jgi:hypothetical protein
VDDAEAASEGAGISSADAAVATAADPSTFSLFGMFTRWNKEGEDMLRMQEFQEQVRRFFLSRLLLARGF